MKNSILSMTRGDSEKIKFCRKNDLGEIILEKVDKVYFTVKKNSYISKFVFQKTLEDGITFDNEGYYHIEIKPNDTEDLEFRDYLFDIEIMIGENYKKTISKGTLRIEEEITHKENE